MEKLLLSSDLEWMRPFIKLVNHIVPLKKLEKIVSVKPRKSQVQHSYGQCVTWTIEGKFSRRYISICLYYWKLEKLNPVQRKLNPFSKIDLLDLLAHELAHILEVDHTPKHKQLESRMISIFMTALEKSGYVSEEHEMQYSKPKYPTL